jgi:hypothetical protein
VVCRPWSARVRWTSRIRTQRSVDRRLKMQ